MTNITTQESLKLAAALPGSKGLVRDGSDIYQPVHYLDEEATGPIDATNRVWKRLDLKADSGDIRGFVSEAGWEFANQESYRNFLFQLRGSLPNVKGSSKTLLVRTEAGLKELNQDGDLVDPDGDFRKNYISVMLNNDEVVVQEVFDVFTDWLGGEEVAHSLLHHLATSLAPGWSPAKYVILIGDGSNGKSILLAMLEALLGKVNVSRASRQAIAAGRPLIAGLNHSLINIIGDGSSERITDSAHEKALTAGESIWIEKKFENDPIEVRTSALFIEALNKEPSNRENSFAMDRRLVRFAFNKRYPMNEAFKKQMLTEEYLGAFLRLLIDHYIRPEEAAVKLAQTEESARLQAEHKLTSSRVLQFLTEQQLPLLQDLARGGRRQQLESPLATAYHVWLSNKKYNFSVTDARAELRDVFEKRKTTRGPNKEIDYNYVGLKETMVRDIELLLKQLGEESDELMVDD